MATKISLDKSLSRELRRTTDRQNNPLILSLLPAEVIELRAKGTRRSVQVNIAMVYTLAKVATAAHEYKEKLESWELKKKLRRPGQRLPKKPFFPYNRLYLDIFNDNVKGK